MNGIREMGTMLIEFITCVLCTTCHFVPIHCIDNMSDSKKSGKVMGNFVLQSIAITPVVTVLR